MNDIATLAPFLALRLLHQNKLRRRPPVNIKGLIMGNPSFDLSLNTDMRAEYYWNIGIMPTSTYLTYLRDCANNPNADYGSDTGGFDVPECMEIWYPVSISTSYLDPFSLYGPPCPGIDQNNIQGPESFTEFVYTCDDQNVAGYFSIPFVQRAIHVRPPPGMTDPPVWLPIKGVGYWKRNVTSAGDYLKSVMEKGVNVLAYSGILDFELPIVSADKALSQMNLTMDTQWRPWFAKSPIEFAGYMTSAKEGLTYATLRNSGRKSSEDQPENVYALVDSFLNNKPLAKSSYFPDA
ncbi:serine carboxypeptidase-like 38 [Wolffia australiana]